MFDSSRASPLSRCKTYTPTPTSGPLRRTMQTRSRTRQGLPRPSESPRRAAMKQSSPPRASSPKAVAKAISKSPQPKRRRRPMSPGSKPFRPASPSTSDINEEDAMPSTPPVQRQQRRPLSPGSRLFHPTSPSDAGSDLEDDLVKLNTLAQPDPSSQSATVKEEYTPTQPRGFKRDSTTPRQSKHFPPSPRPRFRSLHPSPRPSNVKLESSNEVAWLFRSTSWLRSRTPQDIRVPSPASSSGLFVTPHSARQLRPKLRLDIPDQMSNYVLPSSLPIAYPAPRVVRSEPGDDRSPARSIGGEDRGLMRDALQIAIARAGEEGDEETVAGLEMLWDCLEGELW